MKSVLAGLVLAAAAPALAAPVDLVTLYKDLHAHPELAFHELRSAGIMAAEARAAGFEVTEKVGRTGVVAVLKNGKGPTVLIRADMDALPVKEATGLPYASVALGQYDDGPMTPVMHACGHDIHMAVWIGTARWLAQHRNTWRGTVVMIGQPAEEASGGARAMLADGLLTRFPKPDFALALHDNSTLPAGQVSVPLFRALSISSSMDIVVKGVGGHGAYPSTTKDPVALAGRIITALQTIISRENDPFQPAVITVGSIHGGTKHNIIPDEVALQLTIRSYDSVQQQRLIDSIKRVVNGEAIAAGIPERLMPSFRGGTFGQPTLNDTPMATRLKAQFEAKLGKDRVVDLDPSMASEDFQYFGLEAKAPSVIFWLGGVAQAQWEAANAGGPAIPSLHNSGWAPDPAPTIATGVESMTAAVEMLLPAK
ncbi:amidohydrolase [Sandarakinorhabdus limnophila]|uniref:amidohydrolase n=1 Tax=Sandarakinorhabdus limnophila TaxID=210512 RepID=UPI0026EDDBFF|nr:amidohydrolase [Sandarakinorhabdus limnophila]MCM0032862.1 amidohydrolase [Sandarakinorhabdus limnophila]